MEIAQSLFGAVLHATRPARRTDRPTDLQAAPPSATLGFLCDLLPFVLAKASAAGRIIGRVDLSIK
jgi:hypothetical protein